MIDFNKILHAGFHSLGQHFDKILENSKMRLHSYINLKNVEILAMQPKFKNGFIKLKSYKYTKSMMNRSAQPTRYE